MTEAVQPHPSTDAQHKDYYRRLQEHYYNQFGHDPLHHRTRLLNPALCHNLTISECHEWDRMMVQSSRALIGSIESTGFIRILVLLIQFTDHINRTMPPIEDYIQLFNGETITDVTPTGSIAQYILDNSHGRLRIEADIINWTLSDNTEFYYSQNRSGATGTLRFAFLPALDKLEREGYDFTRVDQNQDGKIDTLLVLHSGFAAEVGGKDCYNNREYPHRIWAHAAGWHGQRWTSASTGIQSDVYAVSTAVRGHCRSRPSRMSVPIHEWLHLLGLPDLTDTSGEWIGRGLGHWDIMSDAHARNRPQIYPAHLSPWSKMQLGWIEPTEIRYDGTYQATASELSSDGVYIIRQGFPNDEHLLIENRQPILWDKLLWNGGILIYHIDDTQQGQDNRGWPGQPGWPGNGRHYRVAMLAADGNYDLEIGVNSGNDEDYWRAEANMADNDDKGRLQQLGPSLAEWEATANGTYPNTNSYQFGIILQSGITLSNFSQSGTVMTFRVSGLGPAPLPSPPPSISMVSSINPSQIDSNSQSNSSSESPSSSVIPSLFPSTSRKPSESASPSHSLVPSLLPCQSDKPIVASLPSNSLAPTTRYSDNLLPTVSSIPSQPSSPTSSPSLSASSSFTPTYENPLVQTYGCFSGNVMVNVEGRGSIPMRKLQVGDRVQVNHQRTYERIYSLAHRDPTLQADFVQFLPSMLEMTQDHMVVVKGKGIIPASMVEIGDRLTDGIRVERIRRISRRGVFAPFTPSGLLLVQGVQCSNYITVFPKLLSTWKFLGVVELSVHWIAHTFQTPHRIWCHWLGRGDVTLDGGLSPWLEIPYQLTVWSTKQKPRMYDKITELLQHIMMVPLMGVLGALNFFETVILRNPCEMKYS